MKRLRHIRPGRGRVTIEFRGEEVVLRPRTHVLASASRLLDRGSYLRLLETLDEDLGRFGDVVAVVEELADHVFRGSWQAHVSHRLSVTFATDVVFFHDMLAGSGDTALRLISEFRARVLAPRRGDELSYAANILMSGSLASAGEGAGRGLAEAFLRELAEVLGEPEVARLLGAPGEPGVAVVLYTNRRRFRTLGRGAR